MKLTIKKFLSLLFVLISTFLLVACGDDPIEVTPKYVSENYQIGTNYTYSSTLDLESAKANLSKALTYLQTIKAYSYNTEIEGNFEGENYNYTAVTKIDVTNSEDIKMLFEMKGELEFALYITDSIVYKNIDSITTKQALPENYSDLLEQTDEVLDAPSLPLASDLTVDTFVEAGRDSNNVTIIKFNFSDKNYSGTVVIYEEKIVKILLTDNSTTYVSEYDYTKPTFEFPFNLDDYEEVE